MNDQKPLTNDQTNETGLKQMRTKKLKNLRSTSVVALAVTASVAALNVAVVPSYAEDMNLGPLIDRRTTASINGAMPDISALRYYAVRGEQNRVQTELTRLKKLYPSWQQPQNIFAEGENEEKGLWKLFSEGNAEKLKQGIKQLQKEVAGYVPSDELITKVEVLERRGEIAHAVGQNNWDLVIEQANANPEILVGNDIELIWFVAEAYARKERPQDAVLAYQAALRIAKTLGEQKATIQKAALLLSTERALELLDVAPQLAENSELAGEAADAIVRGALARSAELGELTSSALTPHLESFAVRARMGRNHSDALLLAWSKFGQSDWSGANEWFALAMEIDATPKAVEGSIMSALRLGQMDRAAKLAGRWLNESDEIGALFISVHAKALLQAKPSPMSQEFLQAFAAKTAQLKNGEGSEALAWYAYNIKQNHAASAWFTKALEWEETSTAAFGLALTAARTRDREMFNAIKSRYAEKYPLVAKAKYSTGTKTSRNVAVKRKSHKFTRAGKLRQDIARYNKNKQYIACLQGSRKLREFGPLKADDHQMRGWCLLGAKRPVEAERAFGSSVQLGGKKRAVAAYGQSLAALRAGKTNAALQIANAYNLTAKQRRVIDVELLTQRARAAFSNRDYSASIYALDERAKLRAETRDLSLMRGWAHFHSGRYGHAKKIFAMLEQQYSTQASLRGLNTAKRYIAGKHRNAGD